MTAPVQSPVQAVPAVSLPDNGGAVVNDPVLIFTVPGQAPARIESVRVEASYPVAHLDDWYVLRKEARRDRHQEGRVKVLVVDDDPNIVEILVEYLKHDGRFEIRTAQTGFDAGVMAQQFQPDLIILDYMLPDINGNVVCRTIRDNPDLAQIIRTSLRDAARISLVSDKIHDLQIAADQCTPEVAQGFDLFGGQFWGIDERVHDP